jgi:acetyltransferase-like isoleucine patch superfamily enzyme
MADLSDMPVAQLKDALLRLHAEDPAFLAGLLDDTVLRNPCPPSAAGDWLHVHAAARLSAAAHVHSYGDAPIEIGADTCIDDFAWLRAWGSGIRIGADCSLHQYAMVQGGVTIGDQVRIGAHSMFIATEHVFASRDEPICRQGVVTRGITIASDVYVGSNVVVLDGVHVGEGAVLAAGAVVNRDVPAYCVVGGVPARVIKERPV